MGELNISINNRPFLIACADGDEHNVSRLAEELAARISAIKKNVGEVGDSRLLVMAGLMMCDEIKSLSDQVDALKRQTDAGSQSDENTDDRVKDMETAVTGALTEATQRLQIMISALQNSVETE